MPLGAYIRRFCFTIKNYPSLSVRYSIPPYYDSLIAKLIVHAENREEAISRLKRALEELIVDGVDTTAPLFDSLLQQDEILTGKYNIHWLENWLNTFS